MRVGTASKLDTEKFRKVHALMKGGATDGERAAAKARAEAMAVRAGLTLKQAVSSLDTPTQAKPANFFEGFADWMEEKEPGYKDERARTGAERENRYAQRRSEILKEFGSVRAFMDQTPLEAMLMKAGKPFVTKRSSYEDVCGGMRQHTKEFAGIADHFFNLKDVDPKAVEAIKSAFPFPVGVSAAFEELKMWDKLERDRANFYDHHEYYFDLPVELRVELLREVMKNHPVTSWEDLDARFHYKSYTWQQQWIDETDFEDAEWARLFDDCRILRTMSAASPSSGPSDDDVPENETPRHGGARAQNGHAQFEHRTNADKADAVRSMLRSNPDLSNREIGRRAGVSPQTVGTWRSKMRSGAHG